MAGRLTQVASRIMGGIGVISRSVGPSLRQRSGMGLPVGKHIVPDKPLPADDELVWDNGTPFPEPYIDRIADTVGKYEALAWLSCGLGFFASLGLLAVWNDKASKIPFMCALPERADYLVAEKDKMDAVGVALVLIGMVLLIRLLA